MLQMEDKLRNGRRVLKLPISSDVMIMTVLGWTGIEITQLLPECGRDRLLGPILSLDGEYLSSLMQRAYVRKKKKKQVGGVSSLRVVTEKMKNEKTMPCIHSLFKDLITTQVTHH